MPLNINFVKIQNLTNFLFLERTKSININESIIVHWPNEPTTHIRITTRVCLKVKNGVVIFSFNFRTSTSSIVRAAAFKPSSACVCLTLFYQNWSLKHTFRNCTFKIFIVFLTVSIIFKF